MKLHEQSSSHIFFNKSSFSQIFFSYLTVIFSIKIGNNNIEALNAKIKEIDKNIIKGEKDPEKIVKLLHDYIIFNTEYKEDPKYKTNIAYGSLIEGYALCGGYTDAMAILLNYYNIPNFKVTSSEHTWNAVYLNNKWHHLDVTWNDPNTKIKIVLDHYYLKSTEEILKEDKENQHLFDKNVYSEFKRTQLNN